MWALKPLLSVLTLLASSPAAAIDLVQQARRLGFDVPVCAQMFRFRSPDNPAIRLIECLDFHDRFRARYEDLNLDGMIDRISEQDFEKNEFRIRTDRNFDGRWDRMTRIELKASPDLLYEFSFDRGLNGQFETWTERRSEATAKTCQLSEVKTMKDVFLGPATFLESHATWFTSRETRLNFNIAGSCKSIIGYDRIGSHLLAAIQEGVACLEKQKTPFASNLISKLAALLSNSGQPVDLECTTRDAIGNVLGDATHPNLVLSKPRIRITDNPKHKDSQTLKSTLFHEIIHLLDKEYLHHLPHVPDITNSCEICCFNHTGYSLEAKNRGLHCDICAGRISSTSDLQFLLEYGLNGDQKYRTLFSPLLKKELLRAIATNSLRLNEEGLENLARSGLLKDIVKTPDLDPKLSYQIRDLQLAYDLKESHRQKIESQRRISGGSLSGSAETYRAQLQKEAEATFQILKTACSTVIRSWPHYRYRAPLPGKTLEQAYPGISAYARTIGFAGPEPLEACHDGF